MHSVEDIIGEKNYSKCPLKKRPVTYQFEDQKVAESSKPILANNVKNEDEPENLSLKKTSCDSAISSSTSTIPDDELINVSDCCEDEGVDVDHTDIDEDMDECDEDDDEEVINCVDIEENHNDDPHTTQAAALAAAAAAAAASVVVPTPTYPKYSLQPWTFHMSSYANEFYRSFNPHLTAEQINGDIYSGMLSPSSPSDSIGSLSPPPHYLHGRASSVSPPMRSEIIHRSQHQLPHQQQHHHHHRFMPYTLSTAAYQPHPGLPTTVPQLPAYPLSYPAPPPPPATLSHQPHHPLHSHHHAPISPAYSESSFYSMRSLTPESNCSSSLPEDLSIKHSSSSSTTSSTTSSTLVDCQQKTSNGHKREMLNDVSSSPSSLSPVKKEKGAAPPRYQCPDCQKSYSTFSGLTKHQQFHCPAAEGNQVKKSFSCKDCEKTYVSLGALKMHIRTHTLPCKCNICGKAFSRPWLLQGHIRTHTGEKPFSCQHCHRAFADRSNLRAHLQTHSDIKKYSCTNCSKTFSRMSLLTKHSEGGCSGSSSNSNSSSSNSNGSSSISSTVNNTIGNGSSNEAAGNMFPIYAEH